MKPIRNKKIRAKVKKNEIKRIKIYKLQKRIALLGTFGLLSLVTLILFGYLKDPNQKVNSSFYLNNSKNIQELMNHFLTKIPTIDGEIASSIKTTEQGAWLASSQNNFFTLIEANYKTKVISYKVYQSDFDVTGNWIVKFKEKGIKTKIEIIENSVIDNLGERALLYWLGNKRYCNNLFDAFKSSF